MHRLNTLLRFLIFSIIISVCNNYSLSFGKSRVIRHNVSIDAVYWPDEIPLFDDKGDKYYLDKIEDKVILVMFWASWSTYCLDAILDFDVLKKDFRKLPIEIISVSEDHQGVEVVKKFFQKKNIRHLGILHDHEFKLFNILGLSHLPYAFLIDQNKRIVLEIEGPTKWHSSSIREIILENIPGNYTMPHNSYSKKLLNYSVHEKLRKKLPINPKN